jgi:hypothetical protein
MQSWEFKRKMEGHMHHHAILRLADGTTKEGYAQPPDDEYVYLTGLDGTSAGKVTISDIQSIEFPDG